jgi:hypothetical protein
MAHHVLSAEGRKRVRDAAEQMDRCCALFGPFPLSPFNQTKVFSFVRFVPGEP